MQLQKYLQNRSLAEFLSACSPLPLRILFYPPCYLIGVFGRELIFMLADATAAIRYAVQVSDTTMMIKGQKLAYKNNLFVLSHRLWQLFRLQKLI